MEALELFKKAPGLSNESNVNKHFCCEVISNVFTFLMNDM